MEDRGGVPFSRAFLRRARVFGERLRVRVRFSREESEEGESESGSGVSDMGAGDVWCLAAERVIGAK